MRERGDRDMCDDAEDDFKGYKERKWELKKKRD
jgi:hypothetical protein